MSWHEEEDPIPPALLVVSAAGRIPPALLVVWAVDPIPPALSAGWGVARTRPARLAESDDAAMAPGYCDKQCAGLTPACITPTLAPGSMWYVLQTGAIE